MSMDLKSCPKCGHVVDAEELTSFEDDDRCDECRLRTFQDTDDRRDYYRRIMP
jgi:hypothetical protein